METKMETKKTAEQKLNDARVILAKPLADVTTADLLSLGLAHWRVRPYEYKGQVWPCPCLVSPRGESILPRWGALDTGTLRSCLSTQRVEDIMQPLRDAWDREREACYTVTNVYDVGGGDATYRTVTAALRAARQREGDGWIVLDDDGQRVDA